MAAWLPLVRGERIRIVVVDDHPIVRDGLRALFSTVADVVVVGEATDADGALREVTLHRPDVLLLDVHMPGGTGLEVRRPRCARLAETRVLLLTMDDDAGDGAARRVQLGVDGYLVKGASQDEIMRAVRAVHDGQLILGQAGATGTCAAPAPTRHRSRSWPAENARSSTWSPPAFQRRHRRPAVLSPKTVANYLTSVFAKLAVTDRGQAIIKARDAGLGRG